jgi:DNA-binding response OmpR family regulator
MIVDTAYATIMIVDDEPDNLNVLGDILRQEGWVVRAFPHGELALAAAREEAPDLILLDIRMPGMDGFEVCRRFKADDRLRSIPILFLSASAEPADKVSAFNVGGVDYVTKPFAAVEVLARSHTHLRMRRHQLHQEELVRQGVQALAEAHRRLRIWDDAKNQWLNILSHEMRTPLTGVFGITELLFMDLPADSDQQVQLRKSFDLSCARINKLIDDALTLAQIDVAADSFDMRPVRLMPVLREALDMISGQVPSGELRASVSAVEHVAVLGETHLLNRAFIDLLRTAACCVIPGEVITLAAHVRDGWAEVVIETDGKPLSSEALETFFDVGGQRTLLKGGGDFGLGTALASRILRLFNGRVSVRNGTDKGLVVSIFLPVI